FHLLGLENLQDAADERGLADTWTARDDQRFLMASLPNCLLLPGCQLDPQLSLDPGDGLFQVDLGHGVRRGRCDPVNRLGCGRSAIPMKPHSAHTRWRPN